ncbi:MAG: class I adenylate-forming enzyme family protein, partial [Bacilli bacterium]
GARIKLNSVGKPLIGLNEKIINQETNQEVSYNQEGIICYSGDTTMIRYFDEDIYNKNINNNKGKQQKIIDDNGVEWLCTGSKGYIDEDGYVFLTGRNSYIITYEAEGSPIKIYTDMIRNKICECNAIDNCVVVGQKVDDYRSYAPKVYITLKYGYVYDEELRKILIEKCKTELSLSALPNSIECIASMPLTDAGKINYIYLEQMANKESINTPAVFKKRKK